MSFLKLLTAINWLFISIYGGFIVWILLQAVNPSNDGGGRDMEIAIRGMGLFLLLVLIGLNLTPYHWTKILALVLAVLLLLLIRYIGTH